MRCSTISPGLFTKRESLNKDNPHAQKRTTGYKGIESIDQRITTYYYGSLLTYRALKSGTKYVCTVNDNVDFGHIIRSSPLKSLSRGGPFWQTYKNCK